MQYKVPQNIDMEDKIVGPFTMKQFIYLLVSGGIIYGWWNYLSSYYQDFIFEFAILAIPVALLGFALALVKINDRPFEYFLLSVFKFLLSPKQRKWQDDFHEDPVIIIKKNEKEKKEVTKDTGDLDQLAKQLEDHAAAIQKKEMKQQVPSPATQANPQKAKIEVSMENQGQATQEQVKPTQAEQDKVKVDTVSKPQENKKKKKGILSIFK